MSISLLLCFFFDVAHLYCRKYVQIEMLGGERTGKCWNKIVHVRTFTLFVDLKVREQLFYLQIKSTYEHLIFILTLLISIHTNLLSVSNLAAFHTQIDP